HGEHRRTVRAHRNRGSGPRPSVQRRVVSGNPQKVSGGLGPCRRGDRRGQRRSGDQKAHSRFDDGRPCSHRIHPPSIKTAPTPPHATRPSPPTLTGYLLMATEATAWAGVADT